MGTAIVSALAAILAATLTQLLAGHFHQRSERDRLAAEKESARDARLHDARGRRFDLQRQAVMALVAGVDAQVDQIGREDYRAADDGNLQHQIDSYLEEPTTRFHHLDDELLALELAVDSEISDKGRALWDVAERIFRRKSYDWKALESARTDLIRTAQERLHGEVLNCPATVHQGR